MIKNTIGKVYLNRYYGQANDIATWFNAGYMNLKVAELLLKKYNSAHKRLILEANESVKLDIDTKKRRIDPYHLVLHKYILMFFGYSLECYVKGLLIKQRKLNPLNSDGTNLSVKCLKHLSVQMFNNAISRKTTTEEQETIKRLRRAIYAGKYPIENGMTEQLSAYTAYLDSDIKKIKQMIKETKKMR